MSSVAVRKIASTFADRHGLGHRRSRSASSSYVLKWPSGRGVEIGAITGNPLTLLVLAKAKARKFGRGCRTHMIKETGAHAVVFEGMVINGTAFGPVCLSEDPEVGENVVSIIVDASNDPVPIIAAMRGLFGSKVQANVGQV